MRLSAHFRLSEFSCNDKKKTPVPKRYYKNVRKLAKNLEVLRKALGGKPLHLNSAYRTPRWNRICGGGKRSQHLRALACDIRCSNPKRVYEIAKRLIREGKMDKGGLGYYPTKGFIHYDVRGKNARWRG